MPTHQLAQVLRDLRRTTLARDGAGWTDGQLLECFVARREEAAFEALVRRHGPMVFGVCRRVLRHAQDAEDAFQATFLVLARKAASVRPRSQVGNWLHGVAYRTALKARTAAARRQTRERQVEDMPEPLVTPADVWDDLQPVLDVELSRLPDKYRVPVVLCDLEGKPRKEAARQLGWPEGTLSSRLAAARRLLARRLARYGLALTGGTLAACLARNATAAAVPAPLVLSTVRAAAPFAAGAAATASAPAAALAKGVIHAMLLDRLKALAVAALTLALALGGTGLLTRHGFAADPPAANAAEPGPKADDRTAARDADPWEVAP